MAAGFPCRAILALALMAIIFLQGAETSVDGPTTQIAVMPGSNFSHADTTAPSITLAPRSNSQDGQPDSNEDQMSEDSPIYKLRIEMIKAKILAKLQMERTPVLKNKRRDTRISALLANLNLIQDHNGNDQTKDPEEEYYGKTTKIIVFSERVKKAPSRSKRKVSRNKPVFQFKLSHNTLSNSISSARMWINKRKDLELELNGKTLEVKARIATQDGQTRALTAVVKARKSGWVVMDIKDVIQRWFGLNNTRQQPSNVSGAVLEIEISCKDCVEQPGHLISSRGKFRPFLVINMNSPAAPSRKKRHHNFKTCQGTPVECCRQEMFVNFSRIGWNWIIYPKGFHANYCVGSCESPISLINGYAYLLQEIKRRKEIPFSLCCTPTQTSGISILYFDDDEEIMKKDIPDMRVDSCGCS